LLLDLLENAHNLWYAYFHSHGCFSFLLKVLVKSLLKEKHPFFLLFQNSHKIFYTTTVREHP
jgi:hypothetical protein